MVKQTDRQTNSQRDHIDRFTPLLALLLYMRDADAIRDAMGDGMIEMR